MAKIAKLLGETDEKLTLAERICIAGTNLLKVNGVSISIVSKNVLNNASSSGVEYIFLDEQQFAYGEGPVFEAANSLNPISAHNLFSRGEIKKWPIFAPIATEKGIHSITAFPMRIGSAKLGVLTAYQKSNSEISQDEYVNGLALSALAGNMLIQELVGQKTPDFNQTLLATSYDQSLIHLASGMVAEKLNISIIDAMVRIRAHAYQTSLPLIVIAKKIVDRDLKLEP